MMERLRVGKRQATIDAQFREPGKVVRAEVLPEHSPCRRVKLNARSQVRPVNRVIDALDVRGICT